MKPYDPEKIRNIALVGHGGDGKTSINEALLLVGGSLQRLGTTDAGTTDSDHEPEEIKRKISLSLSLNFLEWDKTKVNLIDTPGDADFIPETMAALAVTDGLVFVLSSPGGVKVQMERVWGRANELSLPRMVVDNRMDRENADFAKAVASVEKVFGARALPLLLPIGKEASFTGVVDVLKGKAYTFTKKTGAMTEGPVPAEMADEVKEAREKLVEAAAEGDDALLEKFLEGTELTPEEIAIGMRRSVIAGTLIPVAAASATEVIGMQPILSAIVDWMPAPTDRPAKKGTTPKGEEVELACSKGGHFAALVFKTIADPFAGKLTLFRVYSGNFTTDASLFNATREAKERTGAILALRGKHQETVQAIGAGDLGVFSKLKETQTGDTLTVEGHPVLIPGPTFPKPVLSLALVPKAKGDEDKISTALHRLQEEDPTLKTLRDDATHEWVISGMGQGHIEITVDRLKRKFGVEVELHPPKVAYKETITAKAEAQGRYKKQTGGRGQFGDCWIRIEPLPRGSGYVFEDAIVGGSIPRNYIPAVDKGIDEALHRGIIAGFPLVDIKVSCFDGSYHSVDSSEMSFKIAGSMAIQKAVKEAKPVLLEPIDVIKVTVPEDAVGDIMGDLNSRRGKVLGMDSAGGYQTVRALVPRVEILRYASDLRSMTGGRGWFDMEFDHFEHVPEHLAKKIIEEAEKHRKEEENQH
jgi:elongation factor G